MRVRISKDVLLPNPVKLARFERSPELGPKILFFSGGSALREASRFLINYTHNSTHIITPFDSGGSSAVIREAFHMLAVGDIRNRLMALADQSLRGNPEIFALFAYRLSKKNSREELHKELTSMCRSTHRLIRAIPDPMRKIIRNHLHFFLDRMPADFDLRGASIGNLVLTGGFLENRRHLDPVIYIFSKLVQVRGTVRPALNAYLHLAAELEDGRTVVGQHLLTGKETGALDSRITRVWLTDDREKPKPVRPTVRKKVTELIEDSELICYPLGSFYSSVVANFLPDGIGRAVAKCRSPKLFVPNTTGDPETVGMTVVDQVETLVHYLKADDPETISTSDVLNFVLVDSRNGDYPGLDIERIQEMGIDVIDCSLIGFGRDPRVDPRFLVPVLLSLT